MKEAGAITKFMERNKGRIVFLEHEVKDLFNGMGFAVPKGKFFRAGEALPGAIGLTYPLIAKVSSSKITSKSDVAGVRAGIRDEVELRRAVLDLSRIEGAEGVLVEETAPQGLEVIIGGVIDNQFGPVVMFGLGGILVELFRDIAFALAPLTKEDAEWLVKQVKGHRLLEGYRGKPSIDKNHLLRMLISVSEVMASGMVREIDLNPVALYTEGAMILDAKMQAVP
jgi:acetyl-CoA synthetase (ADP-forming)